MAYSAISTQSPSLLRPLNNSSKTIYSPHASISFRFSHLKPTKLKSVRCASSQDDWPSHHVIIVWHNNFQSKTYKHMYSPKSFIVSATPTTGGLAPAIALTDNASKHLRKMRSERNEDLCLRIGVRQGGCSGLSYTMDFEDRSKARPDDSVIEYDGFAIVCDPKSLLFLYGMQLDYSDALIGGGFNFKNPNATQTCGCGKSFAAEM